MSTKTKYLLFPLIRIRRYNGKRVWSVKVSKNILYIIQRRDKSKGNIPVTLGEALDTIEEYKEVWANR